jgi:acetyltransferase-like isoleucine patch superfamily enzyme
MPEHNRISGLRNRILAHLALFVPGAKTLRVLLHRWRGVKIGNGVWIGYEVMLENAYPTLIQVGNNVTISIRATIIAHFREQSGVWIGDDVFIGPCSCILPGVRIGKGAVVTAGSVVSSNVAPNTVVQGNPAKPVARCAVPLLENVSLKEFQQGLRPLR